MSALPSTVGDTIDPTAFPTFFEITYHPWYDAQHGCIGYRAERGGRCELVYFGPVTDPGDGQELTVTAYVHEEGTDPSDDDQVVVPLGMTGPAEVTTCAYGHEIGWRVCQDGRPPVVVFFGPSWWCSGSDVGDVFVILGESDDADGVVYLTVQEPTARPLAEVGAPPRVDV